MTDWTKQSDTTTTWGDAPPEITDIRFDSDIPFDFWCPFDGFGDNPNDIWTPREDTTTTWTNT